MFKLFKFLKPYSWQLIFLLLMTVAQTYTSLQLPALTADIINNGIVALNTDYIWQTGAQMILLAIISAVCSLITSYLSADIGSKFSRDIRAAIFAKTVNLDLVDIKGFSTASLTNRTTNDVSQVQQTIILMLSMLLRAPLISITAIVMALQTAPDMSWIIVLGVVVILGSTLAIMAVVLPKFKLFQKLLDRVTMLTRENLTGLRVIRAFNNQKLERNKFAKTNHDLATTNLKIERFMRLIDPIITFAMEGATILCTYIGITLLSRDYSYLGNMSAFAQYVAQIMLSFLLLSMFFVMWPRANVSANRINEVLDTKEKISYKNKTIGIPDKDASVEFKNVDFQYEDADEKVLENISFKAKAGETTAFIGSTGSGKSTLINLVPRFYDATNGDILINDVNIKNYEKDD